MESNYPGYEIDRFENEGGCCQEGCTVCQSIVEVDYEPQHQQMCSTSKRTKKTSKIQEKLQSLDENG